MVLTVGHSNRSLADFLSLLRAHRVGLLADVRAVPTSRAHPHFAREPLETALAGTGIRYLWIPELGGRRQRPKGAPGCPGTRPIGAGAAGAPGEPKAPWGGSGGRGGWTEPGFQAYEAHMATAEFEAGLARLLEAAGETGPQGPAWLESLACSGSGSHRSGLPGIALPGERRAAVMCADAAWWRCHRSMIADALAARGVPVLHILDDRELPHPFAERRGRYAPGVLPRR